MIHYEIEILDQKSGNTRRIYMPRDRTHYAVGWADGESGSIYGWRNGYCDCNLAALIGFDDLVPTCDHSMPPKRYRAIAAHIDDGRVYDFIAGEYR